MLKREWKNLDKVLLVISFLIIGVSLCIIGSATHINKGIINYDFVIRQGIGFIINLALVLFSATTITRGSSASPSPCTSSTCSCCWPSCLSARRP